MQTAYTAFPSAPRAGSLADLNEAIIVTRISESDIPFGRFVVIDADDLTTDNKGLPMVKLPAAATDVVNGDQYNKCEGIAVATQSGQSDYGFAAEPDTSAAPAYLAGSPLNVIRHGIVWVYVEEAVTQSDVPCVRHTADGAKVPGNFNKTADSNSVTLAGYARFMTGTSGAGLAQLMIRL